MSSVPNWPSDMRRRSNNGPEPQDGSSAGMGESRLILGLVLLVGFCLIVLRFILAIQR